MVLTRVPHTKVLSPFLWARQHIPHPLPPLSLPGMQSLPHSLPICLWASATAGFCGYAIFLPLSSMASSGQQVLQARWVFPSLCWEGPKRQPLAPQETGCCMQQESQAAAKPRVQTLYMCIYSFGFIALLLGIY